MTDEEYDQGWEAPLVRHIKQGEKLLDEEDSRDRYYNIPEMFLHTKPHKFIQNK